MASIAILIGTPEGPRLLAASLEREAALMAESVIAGFARTTLPVPVWVQCANADVTERLMRYLADLQVELVSAEDA